MRRVASALALIVALAALAGSCGGDDNAPAGPTTGGGSSPSSTGGGDGGSPTTTGQGGGAGGATAGNAGAGGGLSDGGLISCPIDRPDDLPRPPTNELPCELLPPGFTR